jgi:putative nucleotidyltransferase with HDIG domain
LIPIKIDVNAELEISTEDEKQQRIEDLIQRAPKLPASFHTLPRLLALLDDPNAGCDDLAEMIRIDPALTAALFRVSNSATYSGGQRAKTLPEAVGRLGMREVYRVVLQIVTAPALNAKEAALHGRVDLWRHSLATAVAAQTLAEHLTTEDPEVVFSAALLHDIGKSVLVRAGGEHYVKLLENCATTSVSVDYAEREEYGFDHAELGAQLLRAWKFPDQIVAAVGGHHNLLTARKDYHRIAVLVSVGNILAYRLGAGNGCPVYVSEPDAQMLETLGLSRDTLTNFDAEICERFERERQRL